MEIKKENLIINNKNFVRHYHETFKIKKVGTEEVYDEAIDLEESQVSYELTDIERVKELEDDLSDLEQFENNEKENEKTQSGIII